MVIRFWCSLIWTGQDHQRGYVNTAHPFWVCLALLGPSQPINVISKNLYACMHRHTCIFPISGDSTLSYLLVRGCCPQTGLFAVMISCIIVFLHGGFICLSGAYFTASRFPCFTVSIWPNGWELMIFGVEGDAKEQHWNLYCQNHILFFGLYIAYLRHTDKNFFRVIGIFVLKIEGWNKL